MEAGLTIFYQIIKMFIMMMVGYGLYKKAMINDDTTAKLSNILLMVATPCTIISSFNQAYSNEKLMGLVTCFVLSFIAYSGNILISRILYRKESEYVERFCVVFSNAGFIGIPLVTGLMGAEAVFYLSPFIVGFYLFVWTYGVIEMSGDKSNVTIKKIVTNPCIWAVLAGIVVFLLPVKPFTPIMEAITMMGNMNTPMAMLVLGAYLAKENLIEIFTSMKMYLVSFYRLILIPAVYMVLFAFLPIEVNIKTIILIGAAAPVGALAPVFAQMYKKDTGYGAKIVCLSTILSLITMPIILVITEMIW